MNRRSLLAGLLSVAAPRVVGLPKGLPTSALSEGAYRVVGLGDPIGAGLRFGSDNDFTAPFALPGEDDRLLLWVNHEEVPLARPRYDLERFGRYLGRPATLADTLEVMGGSVVELVREGRDGAWRIDPRSTRSWRVSGHTPMRSTGPVALEGVVGTFENCGGGLTPWGTVLTCEENVRYLVPEGPGTMDGGVQGSREKLRHPEFAAPGQHYGWVVEVDPRDPTWTPRKHTALGRFRHENVSVEAREGRPLRLYMGDDRRGGGLWRFTSARPWSAALGREEGSALLEEGVLHLADLEGGRWVLVGPSAPVVAPPPATVPAPYLEAHASARTLGDIYRKDWQVDAWVAGVVAGGSQLGRPEGTVILDGALHVALTEPFAGRPAGVLRMRDSGDTFEWEWALVAGPDLVGPDNLAADGGALLIATDGDDAVQANALYRLRRGRLERLLTAPPDAEITGPSVAPDRSAIFCCIQHPAPSWGNSQVVALPLR